MQDVYVFGEPRARRCDLWGRQCDQLLLSGTKFSHLVANLAPQDRWRSSLGKRTLMIICYPLQNQRIANGFANALTFCPNALTVYLNVLTICLNALTISSNAVMDCSYDLTVGPSNVWLLFERGLWKSQVMNATEVLLTFGQINRNSQQTLSTGRPVFLREWLLAHRFKTIS